MIIEPGIITYKLIIPLIYPFLYQIRRYIHKDDEKPFYEFFTNYCGYLLSGLVYLLVKYRMKKKQKNLIEINEELADDIFELSAFNDTITEKNKSLAGNFSIKGDILDETTNIQNQIVFEREKIHKSNKRKKYLFILLLSGIYLVPMFLDSFCSTNKSFTFKTSSSISLFFCIIGYVIFSSVILGDKIYKHQILSLIIIITCNIVSIILLLLKEKNIDLLYNVLLMAIILTLYALFNTLEKYYFNTYMGSPYHLMFFVGLISLCIIVPYEIITVLAASKDELYNGIFYQIELNFKSNKLYPLIFIGDIISAFFWVAGIHLTVYFFTPCHFITSEAISQILSTLIGNTLKERTITIKIIIYALFGIIFLASLIYNEVFIINLCDLGKNTKKHIIERERIEKEEIQNSNKMITKCESFESN